MDREDVEVTSGPAEVLVVARSDAVLLLVDGDADDASCAFVDELRRSLVVTGTPADEVQVIWRGRAIRP